MIQMINVLIESLYLDNIRFQKVLESFRSVVISKKEDLKIIQSIAEVDPKERIVIIFGYSLNWIEEMLNELLEIGKHPLVFGARPRFHITPFSYLSKDYLASFYLLTKYIASKRPNKNGRIAFLGFNADSPHDLYKEEGFEKACQELAIPYQIFPNPGSSDELFKNFLPHEDDFDTVITVADSITILYLSKSDKAKTKNLASFGGYKSRQFSDDKFMTCDIDYEESGVVLANLFFFLNKQKTIYPVSIKLPVKIVDEEISFRDFDYNYPKEKELDFFHDKPIEEVDRLEKMFLAMDETDIKILEELKNNVKYEDVAEQLYISINTIKYRMNKILRSGNFKSKGELFLALKKYHMHV